MNIKIQQRSTRLELFLRSWICICVTTVGLYINRISKDYYYKLRSNRHSQTFVRGVVHGVLAGSTKGEPAIINPSINVERPSNDCAITVDINHSLEGVIPRIVKTQVKKVLKYMKLNQGVVRLHYEGEHLKFVGLLKDKKYASVAIKQGNGWYDQNGKQLNIKYSIPNFLSLIKSNDIQKKPRISSGYGYRIHPVHKRKIFHAGIDIAGPNGSSVFAALPGKVKKIAYSKSYGTYIVLEHQGGLETFYAHLRSIDRRLCVDKEVAQGIRIGFVGQSGHATGPHLHFEVRKEKKHINPHQVKPLQLTLGGYELSKLKKVYKFYKSQLKNLYIPEYFEDTTKNKSNFNKVRVKDESIDHNNSMGRFIKLNKDSMVANKNFKINTLLAMSRHVVKI